MSSHYLKIPQNYSSEQNQSLVETWVPLLIFPSDKLFTSVWDAKKHTPTIMFELISELWHSIRGHCMGSNLFLILKSTGCSPWQWTECHYQTFTALAMDFIILSNVVCLCSSWVYKIGKVNISIFLAILSRGIKARINLTLKTGINMDQKLPTSEIHWIKEHVTRSFFQRQWCQMPSL